MSERLTVRQAALRLGVSESAVRQRIHRDSIPYEKDESGRVYILFNDLDNDVREAVTQDPRDDLIEELRQTNEFLKSQLEARSDELAEMRRIIAALTQRIPELEPAKEPASEQRESPVTTSEEEAKGESPREPEKAELRPWWRRLFSG